MVSKLLAVVQSPRVHHMTLELQIDRPRHLPAGSALDRAGAQVAVFSIHQRHQIAAYAMHHIVLSVSQPLARFRLRQVAWQSTRDCPH